MKIARNLLMRVACELKAFPKTTSDCAEIVEEEQDAHYWRPPPSDMARDVQKRLFNYANGASSRRTSSSRLETMITKPSLKPRTHLLEAEA